MLDISGVSKHFGGFAVVRECSLGVRAGEIVGLIGPNGAGKTTLFNCITGLIALDGGSVRFSGQDITAAQPDLRARMGLVRTFQIPRPFEQLSVIENLLVAAPHQLGERFWSVWVRPGAISQEEKAAERKAWKVLEFLNLVSHANALASDLSGGQKKLLELGRALMLEPSLILLDEPVAGVNPRLMEEIADRVRDLRADGLTFLIIEHKMEFIMSLADRLYVMADGAVIAEGSPSEVRGNKRVLEAYLGVV